MIRLLTAGTRITLVAVALAVSIPAITFAQTSESATGSTSSDAESAPADTSSTVDGTGLDNDISLQEDSSDSPATPAAVEAENQSHIDELRREILDDRAKYIDRWLSVIGIVLTFFGIVLALAGIWAFGRFRTIEAEAKNSAEAANKHAAVAKKLVDEIKEKRDEGEKIIQNLNAQTAADDPKKAKQAAEDVLENPRASLIEKAIAAAVSLQRQDKRDETIEKWRAIAHITQGSDDALAARAWFSVGYLLMNTSLEEAISAYDKAVRLDPSGIGPYINRGNAKDKLGRHEEALADFDEAIRLDPDYAEAYSNRGNVKDKLGRHEEALADFDRAILP